MGELPHFENRLFKKDLNNLNLPENLVNINKMNR